MASKSSKQRGHRAVVINRDRARPRNQPNPTNPEVEARLTELVSPITFGLVNHYRALGLRNRVLTLPIMVALLLAMIWRQVASAGVLVRVIAREPLLWAPRQALGQRALNLRLASLPAALFAKVLEELLVKLEERAASRTKRPQKRVVAQALRRFERIWVLDGSRLEEVARKLGSLRGESKTRLGGIFFGILDLPTRLPVKLWYDPDADASEFDLLEAVKAHLQAGTLLLFDVGLYAFHWFDWLSDQKLSFVTRIKANARYEVVRRLVETECVHDYVIKLGLTKGYPCKHPLRLVEVYARGEWHRYLTNVLDPFQLSTGDVVDLYAERWRIEEAFLLAKRLLGLSYLWTGSANGIALQLWATWLLYAVLVDLSDAVADQLEKPLGAISFEMVYRGLYHYVVARHNGLAADPVAYLAAPEQADLGIVKARRPKRERDRRLNRPAELDPPPTEPTILPPARAA